MKFRSAGPQVGLILGGLALAAVVAGLEVGKSSAGTGSTPAPISTASTVSVNSAPPSAPVSQSTSTTQASTVSVTHKTVSVSTKSQASQPKTLGGNTARFGDDEGHRSDHRGNGEAEGGDD